MRTISYSEARQNLSATMMKAVEDHAPILITRQNGEACVLMSLEEYTRWKRRLIYCVPPLTPGD